MADGLNVGTVTAKFKADVTDLKNGISQAKSSMASLSSSVQSIGSGISSFFSKAGQQAQAMTSAINTTAMIGGAALGALGAVAIKGAADFEQTKIALTTMMGSAEDAGNLLQEISKFAAETPFEMPELATTTKQLMAFGFSAGEAVDGMKTLGDISAGLNVPIGDLAYLLGTLKAQGRAMTIDIRQFAMRGLPIYDSLAKVMNVSKEKVSELVEAGKVGFPEVNKALQSMTAEGGKFHGSMAAQATSLKGLFSTLSDNVGFTLREIMGINLKGEVREGSIFDILRTKAADFINFLDTKKEAIAAFFTNMVTAIQSIGQSPIFQALVDGLTAFAAWIVANKDTVLPFLQGLGVALASIYIVTTIAGAIAALASPIGLIIAAITLLYVAWTTNFGGIRDYTMIFWEYIKTWIADFKEGWDNWGVHIWNSAKSTFMTIWSIIKFVVQLITDVITVFILFFSGEWGAMWEAIKTGAQHALDNIKAIFGNAWDAIKEGITGIYNHFVGKFTEMWEKAKEVAENIRHAISSAFDKDAHNSPSIADRVNDLKGFIENNQFGFTPNVAPVGASTVNQTINANINGGVDVNFLGERMRFMMRSNY
jgi:phage-related protein